MADYIEREEVKKEIIEWASRLANPKYLDRDATLDIIRHCGVRMEEVRKYD